MGKYGWLHVEIPHCETDLYLLSMLAYTYNIIIDFGDGAKVHVREAVDSLNDTGK